MDAHSKALLKGLSEKQQKYAISRYENKKKSVFTAYLLWFCFASYYFYLNRPLLNVLLWAFCFIFVGFLWLIVDLFRIPGLVEQRNRDIFVECIKDAKAVFD